MYNNATERTANNSMYILDGIFGEQVISQGYLPPLSSYFNPCDFHLWGTFKERCMWTIRILWKTFKTSLGMKYSTTPIQQLQLVSRNILMTWTMLRKQKHFKTLLWNKVKRAVNYWLPQMILWCVMSAMGTSTKSNLLISLNFISWTTNLIWSIICNQFQF